MSDFLIAPIVGGHGEVQAVPILLQRIFREVQPDGSLKINPPIRIKSGSFFNDTVYFNRHVELAARKAGAHPNGSMLILLDSEDACPGILGPRLLERARGVNSNVQTLVALAHREYETWFLAAAQSLRCVAGLPEHLEVLQNPENLRNAKGWLSSRMLVPYNEPDHQPILTRAFAFKEASRIQSFDRLYKKLRFLFSSPGT